MPRVPRVRPLPLLLSVLLGIALVTPVASAQEPIAPTPTPIPIVPTATPSPSPAGGTGAVADRVARASAIQSAALVLQEGWDLLLDRYVEPLDPLELARAAYEAMLGVARDQGLAPEENRLEAVEGRAAAWAALTQRYQALANRYPSLDPTALVHAALAAMARTTDDTHTHFLTPREYQEHLAWTRGEVRYGGIGARLRGPVLTIVEVFAGTPAASAGLRPGDQILKVGDVSTQGLRVDEAVNLVRGPEGTTVTLTIQRAGTAQVEQITLTRAEIQVPFVESRRIENFGYVRLRGFPEPSVVDAVERAITDLQSQGVQGLILDLRGNSGGRLDVGTRLLSRFVPDGPVYQEVDRRGRQAVRYIRRSTPILTVPLVVLIDEGTASMGEIFAINIQEHRVGRLIGTTTMGSVAASQVLPLSDGSALQLSVMQILSGQGQQLNRVGVQPDERVELRLEDLQSGQDVQLQRGVDYLRGLASRG
ncbi:MAG TPA: S41 family peptidase [Chloroflexota bacterium]|nr:S41 family peptidase [Chloroflexota bacterium]